MPALAQSGVLPCREHSFQIQLFRSADAFGRAQKQNCIRTRVKPAGRPHQPGRPPSSVKVKSEAVVEKDAGVSLAKSNITEQWKHFQRNVSGEWEGITAKFNAQ